MIKVIKKVLLSSLSILAFSFLIWLVLMINPSLSYAHDTQFDFVRVYHNQPLDQKAASVIQNAVDLIKQSNIFQENIQIELCMNDDKVYPYLLQPIVGNPLAYAFFDKTTLKSCTVNFNENQAETKWAFNNFEHRTFNLTWLLAHEFMHNLQFKTNLDYVIKSTMGTPNWKLEGHAEYISRGYKNDGLLKNKIERYILESEKNHNGIPVIELKDGSKQNFSYYKYALVVQYLMEVKGLSYFEVCALETSLEDLQTEMMAWQKK